MTFSFRFIEKFIYLFLNQQLYNKDSKFKQFINSDYINYNNVNNKIENLIKNNKNIE